MIFGTTIDKTNPSYSIADFTFWFPQFKNYMETDEGQTAFDNLYPIANDKIFESIYGTDWKLAMGYCIAHYLTLIAQQSTSPSGTSLSEIAGGGTTKGVLQSASIGGFSKSYALDKTMVSSEEALFWNATSYGASLMALLKTKAVPSMFVITNDAQPNPFVAPKTDNILPF